MALATEMVFGNGGGSSKWELLGTYTGNTIENVTLPTDNYNEFKIVGIGTNGMLGASEYMSTDILESTGSIYIGAIAQNTSNLFSMWINRNSNNVLSKGFQAINGSVANTLTIKIYGKK